MITLIIGEKIIVLNFKMNTEYTFINRQKSTPPFTVIIVQCTNGASPSLREWKIINSKLIRKSIINWTDLNYCATNLYDIYLQSTFYGEWKEISISKPFGEVEKLFADRKLYLRAKISIQFFVVPFFAHVFVEKICRRVSRSFGVVRLLPRFGMNEWWWCWWIGILLYKKFTGCRCCWWWRW